MSKLARPLLTLSVALAMTAAVLCCAFSSVALADGGNDGDFAVADAPSLRDGDKPARTIMIYMDGSSSEEDKPVCTAMLKEYMASKFDSSQFRIIIMTGGSLKWHLEKECLRDKRGNADTIDEISSEYNQIWEVHGATDTEGRLPAAARRRRRDRRR